jgi:hypothetical protein
MKAEDPKRFVQDGFSSLERGINSGVTPNLCGKSQASFAVNTQHRGGYATNRPRIKKHALNFPSQEIENLFLNGVFQGAEFYNRFDGPSVFLVSESGRQFTFEPAITGYSTVITEVTPPDGGNSAGRNIAWMVQAENYMVLQDGQAVPIILLGAGPARRSTLNTNVLLPEVPIGREMAYGLGRLKVALPDSRQYVIGDIAYGATDVINFLENSHAAEGGAWTVPFEGFIAALRHTSVLDGQTTQGELTIGTSQGMASAKVGIGDRFTWKDIDFQRVALASRGPTGQYSTITVNWDIWFRGIDGIRSMSLSRQEFGSQFHLIPMSREMARIIRLDNPLYFPNASMVFWNNRLLYTIDGAEDPNGQVYFKGLAALDFDVISDLSNQTAPAWDGLWTGMQPFRIITGEFYGRDRCFIFVRNEAGGLEFWEMEEDGADDEDEEGPIPIYSFIETRSFDFESQFEAKKLVTGEVWIDKLDGRVSFDVKYRPDQYPCWVDWTDFQRCAKTEGCLETDIITACPTVATYNEQYRPRLGFGVPADSCDPVTNRNFRVGYEFQVRFQWIGRARIRKMVVGAYRELEQALAPCAKDVS